MISQEHLELLEFINSFEFNASYYDCFDYFVARDLMPEQKMRVTIRDLVESGALKMWKDWKSNNICYRLNSPIDIVRLKNERRTTKNI